jgi:hypothetical protein
MCIATAGKAKEEKRRVVCTKVGTCVPQRKATAPIRPRNNAPRELIWTDPAPLLAGAEVPVAPEDVAPEGPLPVADVARVVPDALLPEAEPEAELEAAAEPEAEAEAEAAPEVGRVSLGTTTVLPASEPGALVTVGTDAGGVTWIWPSEYCDTGTAVEVAAAVVVMLAQGVVPTWT